MKIKYIAFLISSILVSAQTFGQSALFLNNIVLTGSNLTPSYFVSTFGPGLNTTTKEFNAAYAGSPGFIKFTLNNKQQPGYYQLMLLNFINDPNNPFTLPVGTCQVVVDTNGNITNTQFDSTIDCRKTSANTVTITYNAPELKTAI